MRKSILRCSGVLLVVVTGSGCGDAAPRSYAVVDVVAASTPVHCERFRVPGDPAPTEIRLATDSTWTLLDAARREIIELDDGLGVRSRTPIPGTGPGAAPNAVSVAAVGDTAWAVAARGGLRLVVLSRTGEALGIVPLDFIPHSLEAAGDDFLLTAMPFGTKPPTVLVRVVDGRVVPVPIPKRSYADMMIGALGNTALVETLPDGEAIVIHQFMAPRAFRVSSRGEVASLVVPIPAATRHTLDFVPVSPLTEDQMLRTAVPAIGLSVDGRRGEVYLLTRSGRDLDGRPERAVLRLTRELGFLEGFLIDVPAAGLVYLPRTGTAVVYDDQDRYHACRLGTGAHRVTETGEEDG